MEDTNFDGEWEDELRSTFLFDDGTKIEFDYGAPSDTFDLLIKNPNGIDLSQMILALNCTESQLKRDLELINRAAESIGKSVLIEGDKIVLSNTIVRGARIEKTKALNLTPNFRHIGKNTFVPIEPFSQKQLGRFIDHTLVFEFHDKTQRKIYFPNQYLANFFDVIQSHGSSNISFEYIRKNYVRLQSTLIDGLTDKTIQSYTTELSSLLKKQNVHDVRVICLNSESQIVFLTNYEF